MADEADSDWTSVEVANKYKALLSSREPETRDKDSPGESSTSPDGVARSPKIERPPKLQRVVDIPDPDRFGNVITLPLDRYSDRHRRDGQTTVRASAWSGNTIVVRRVIENGYVTQFQVEIKTERLQLALEDIVAPFRDVWVLDGTMIIPDPFRSLFHGRAELKSMIAAKDQSDPLKEEMQLLYDFVVSKEALGDTIREYDSLLRQKVMTFNILWSLYPPRALVVSIGNGSYQCFRVEDAWFDNHQGRLVVKIILLSNYHNGERGGLHRSTIMIPWYNGTAQLHPRYLPLVPLEHLPQDLQGEVRESTIRRGKEFVRLQTSKYSFMEIVEGGFWGWIKEDEMTVKDSARESIPASTNSRVVVDAAAAKDAGQGPQVTFIARNWDDYLHPDIQKDEGDASDTKALVRGRARRVDPILNIPIRNPQGTGNHRRRRTKSPLESSMDRMLRDMRDQSQRLRRDSSSNGSSHGGRMLKVDVDGSDDNKAKDPDMTDDDYMLFPPKIKAFLLDRKVWVDVLIDGLDEIEFYPDPFQAVQLAHEKKHLVNALVKGFDTGRDSFKGFDDIVQGKGRGLFFLLHGESGLGKTFTAEAIAEETKRPLYHVSTGELGTNIREMEEKLSKVFKLGWRWGAIVLIDEADVLVAKRTDNEMGRNAVVAMFLNLVEYYKGLLFVTTNRVQAFDDAFKNRMHAIIQFPKLEYQARLNIWTNLLINRKNPVEMDSSWSDDQEELRILAKLELNGRDIRNLIRTACGYANSYEKELGVRHVIRVLRETASGPEVAAVADELAPALARVKTFYPDNRESGNVGESSRTGHDMGREGEEQNQGSTVV